MVGGGGGVGAGLLENANPLIYERSGERPVTAGEEDEQVPDSIDAREIFDIRRCRAGGLAGAWEGAEATPSARWWSVAAPGCPGGGF